MRSMFSSCSPNLTLCSELEKRYYADRHDYSIYDIVVFVALKDLAANEELFFEYAHRNFELFAYKLLSYNRDYDGKAECTCKSPDCKGIF